MSPRPVVRSIVTPRAEATTGPLEAWGHRPGAHGEAETSGQRLLDQEGLPGVGIWSCTPGAWAVEDRTDTETSVVLSGRGRITDIDGEAREIGPGDVLILPLGWTGTWEILEPLRKLYVVAT